MKRFKRTITLAIFFYLILALISPLYLFYPSLITLFLPFIIVIIAILVLSKDPIIQSALFQKPLVLFLDSKGVIRTCNCIVEQDRIKFLDKEKTFDRDALFSLEGIPVFLYNEITNSLLTKTQLADLENIYLGLILKDIVDKVEELNQRVRDFARGVIKQALRPGFSFDLSKNIVFIVAIIIAIAIAFAIISSGGVSLPVFPLK